MSKISLKHSGGNVVSLNSPTSAPTSADVAFKLPNADGTSGQAIITDASGNLSFAGTGKILQTVTSHKVDGFTTTSSSFVDLTGISRTITPTAASSKINIIISLHVGGAAGSYPTFNLLRGSTIVTQGTYGSGSMTNCSFGTYIVHEAITQTLGYTFLDSPTYSLGDTLTYKLQIASQYQSKEVAVNRNSSGTNASYSLSGTSTITVMEVAA